MGFVEVISAGFLTTVQDEGRTGYRRYGVPVGGPMDWRSARLANRLLGNRKEAALLECTLSGPELRFSEPTEVAVTGGLCPTRIGDLHVPRGRPFTVGAGQVLSVGPVRKGCRVYVAVSGGLDVTPVLGSRSSTPGIDLGLPPLRPGVRLPVGHDRSEGFRISRARLDDRWLDRPHVRVMPGPEFDLLSDPGDVFDREFRVSSESDRMGIRLAGARVVHAGPTDIRPSAVLPGTVQMTSDGSLVVLVADAQTTGGYARVLQAVRDDLPILGQRQPGDVVVFRRAQPPIVDGWSTASPLKSIMQP